MSSYPIRDQKKDHLLTPENSALLVIDYQPTQINSVNSMDRAKLLANIISVVKIARNYKLPVVLSTVNVDQGTYNDTIPSLRAEMYGINSIDRTSMNAWEDEDFYEAVKATKRKKLIMTALWSEGCMSLPTLDALQEGFEVYPVVDAIGGTSVVSHETALRRVEQAGAQLISVNQMMFELQRDWNRQDTVPGMIGIMREAGIFLKLD